MFSAVDPTAVDITGLCDHVQLSSWSLAPGVGVLRSVGIGPCFRDRPEPAKLHLMPSRWHFAQCEPAMTWQRVFVSRQRSQGLLRFDDLYGRDADAGDIFSMVVWCRWRREESAKFEMVSANVRFSQREGLRLDSISNDKPLIMSTTAVESGYIYHFSDCNAFASQQRLILDTRIRRGRF